MPWNNRQFIREERPFTREEVKKLKKEELLHLFIDSAINGWDTVEQQQRYHAKERAANPNPDSEVSRANCWEICWECEAIFKKLQPEDKR